MATWPSLKFHTYSFEIKISRGDFLRELRNPEKRNPGMAISNYFYFVTGPNIAETSEIPEGCGLMVAGWNGDECRVVVKAKAPFREVKPFTDSFVASILRRTSRLERCKSEIPKVDALK